VPAVGSIVQPTIQNADSVSLTQTAEALDPGVEEDESSKVEPRNCPYRPPLPEDDIRPLPSIDHLVDANVGVKEEGTGIKYFWFGTMLFCYLIPEGTVNDNTVEPLLAKLFIPVQPKTPLPCPFCHARFLNIVQFQAHFEQASLTEICPTTESMVLTQGASAHFLPHQVLKFLTRISEDWPTPVDMLDACRSPMHCGGVSGKYIQTYAGEERNKEKKTLNAANGLEDVLHLKSKHLWDAKEKKKKVGSARAFGPERFIYYTEFVTMAFLLPAKRWPRNWKEHYYKTKKERNETSDWAWHRHTP
jgi:hypothetical protein